MCVYIRVYMCEVTHMSIQILSPSNVCQDTVLYHRTLFLVIKRKFYLHTTGTSDTQSATPFQVDLKGEPQSTVGFRMDTTPGGKVPPRSVSTVTPQLTTEEVPR